MTNVYIDEIYLQEKLNENNQHALEELIETYKEVKNSPLCQLFIVENIYDTNFKDSNFTDALFKDATGNRDIIRDIQIIIDRAETFPYNQQNEHGLQQLLRIGTGGLISSRDIEGTNGWNVSTMAKIETASGLPTALRLFFLAERRGDNDLQEQAEHLFPNIYFYEQVNLRKLGLQFLPHIKSLINHLTYLNDRAIEHFNGKRQAHEIIAEAAALDVTISPESPKTRQNQRAMRDRQITINGINLVCEWHSKITYDTGRIHFYAFTDIDPRILEISEGKVIIGVVAPHLPT